MATYSQLYSITKKEEKKKGAMGSTRKIVIINDFRLNEAYDEDIDALKQKAEKYISLHPELSDSVKASLRELKVATGFSREEVELLLGRPDKIVKSGEEWVYKINKTRIVTVFIVPVFPVNESYRLYFKDNALMAIERHFLKQVVQQSQGQALYGAETKLGTEKQ